MLKSKNVIIAKSTAKNKFIISENGNILYTPNETIPIIAEQTIILIISIMSNSKLPPGNLFLQFLSNKTVVIKADKLVEKAKPPIPKIFENNIFITMFITTPIAALIIGVLVLEYA